MPISTSELFNFLEHQKTGVIERHIISLHEFNVLRINLWKIVLKLGESDDLDTLTTSAQLRVLLSEWLTTPAPFDHSLSETILDVLGTKNNIQLRWGSDIANLCNTAVRAAEALAQSGNPARIVLRDIIIDLVSRKEAFKIYCHRQANQYYESLFTSLEEHHLNNNIFLHSVRDYRESETFDVLIKFGPLRTRGWGSAPDSLITAPHYRKLVQILWTGCSDEPEFGYDPVRHPGVQQTPGNPTNQHFSEFSNEHMGWIENETQHTDGVHETENEFDNIDELYTFKQLNQKHDRRAATLLTFGEQYGMLYPPYSHSLSFDPDDKTDEAIGLRIPDETLHEGMFGVVPLGCEADLGGIQANRGHYSTIWKSRLVESLEENTEELLQRLRVEGVNLRNLESALYHWCKPPSTVIHAP